MVNYPPGHEDRANLVLERIKKTGSSSSNSCVAIEADLSTLEGPSKLVTETVKACGERIDILVNNAGLANMTVTKDIEMWQWDLQVNLNARATLLLTQAVLPYLAKPSRIVNISSVGARQAYAGSAIYNGTKSMVESFTRVWAMCDPPPLFSLSYSTIRHFSSPFLFGSNKRTVSLAENMNARLMQSVRDQPTHME